MTTMPTPGRVVHYVSYGTPGGEYASVCRPATVTEVGAWVNVVTKEQYVALMGQRAREVVQNFQPETCALLVMNPTGLFFNTVGHNEDKAPGTWHWPCVRSET